MNPFLRALGRSCCLAVLLFAASASHAQLVPYYTFSQTTSSTYSAISATASTLIDSGALMDEGRYAVSLPFTFYVDGTGYSAAYIHTNGYIALGTTDPGANEYYGIATTGTGFITLAGMSCNLAGRSGAGTRLHTITTGTAPNRVYTIEWKNFGYPGTTVLNVNFQLHLYESSNVFDVTYGSCSLGGSSSSLSVQAGIRGLSNLYYFHRSAGAASWTSTNNATSASSTILYTTGNNPSSGLTYTFTPPPPCGTPVQPTALTLTPTFTSVSGSFTASSTTASRYLVVQTVNGPLNTTPANGTYYNANATLGNGTVVSTGASTSFNSSGLNMNTAYTYTVFSYSDGICIGAPTYNTQSPLTATVVTPRPRSYTWNATSSIASWTNASNWTPARNFPHPLDTLNFSNGGSSAATSVPTQTVDIIRVSNNTAIELAGTGSPTLSFGRLLQVDTGSTLTLSGALNLGAVTGSPQKMINAYGTVNVGGTCILYGRSAAAVFNTALNLSGSGSYVCATGSTTLNGNLNQAGTSAYVTASGTTVSYGVVNLNDNSRFDLGFGSSTTFYGTINCMGAGARMSMFNAGNPTVSFNGGSVYNHQRDGGNIPYGIFNQLSTINITGITGTAPVFESSSGPVGKVVWNCPGQSTSLTLQLYFLVVRGDLVIQNTGSYVLQNGSTSGITVQGSFIQNGGTFQVSNSNPMTFAGVARLNGGVLDIRSTGGSSSNVAATFLNDLMQSPGHIITNGSSLSSLVSFDGTAVQHVDLGGGTAPVPISYMLNNPTGVILSDTLYVNQGAGNTINAGYWLGTGTILYAPAGSLLSYRSATSRIPTAVEWPASNGPANLSVNMTGAFPDNRFRLHGPRSLFGNLTLSAGTIQLGSSDLRVDGTITSTTDSMKMIAADGGGQLLRLIPAGTGVQNIDFPVGDLTGIPQYSPVRVQAIGNGTARYIGVRVTDAKHPAETASNHVSRYWSFSDSQPGSALSYKLTFNYPGTELVGSFSQRLSRWDGTGWNLIPSVVSNALGQYKLEPMSVLNSAQQPLNGNDFTGRAATGNIYSWNGSVSTDYRQAQNWSPARTAPDPSDILQWNSGGIDTVRNIPNDTVSRLVFTNGTTAVLQPAATGSGNTVYLIATSDYNAATPELRVDAGATLVSNGNQKSFVIGLAGDSCRGLIDGKVILASSNATGSIGNRMVFDCPGCVTTVSTSGYLAAGEQANNNTGFESSDTARLVMYGTYEHRFMTVAGGIPTAGWKPGSNALITGYTTSIDGPYLNGRNFYNLTYNCPNQSSVVTNGNASCSVAGTTRVISTGSGEWRLGAGFSMQLAKYLQTGGTVNLGVSSASRLSFTDSVFQSGGVMYNSGTAATELDFRAPSGVQEVSFLNNAPVGPVFYRFSAPGGVHLSGTGTLGSMFDINTGGGVRISAASNTPLVTTLRLRYNGVSSLEFDNRSAFHYLVDTLIYPALNSPANLWISVPGASVTIPGSRSIPGVLTLIDGDLNIGANDITIGASAASPGALSRVQGDIRTTTGSVTRWYGVTGLPTSLSNPGYPYTGLYPIAYGNSSRAVSLYFSTSTALSSGGTITISHSNAAGLATGLSVADGSYTVGARTNAGWTVSTGNGFSMTSATISMRVTASDLFSVASPANLRLMNASSVPGSHVAGSGTPLNFMAQRSGLTQSDISGATFYVGASASTFDPVFISVADGNWNTPATWNLNAVPDTSSTVYISAGDTVTISSAAAAKTLYVTAGGLLHASSGTLRTDSTIITDGTFLLAGSTVNLGPAGGGKLPFVINDYGTLNVASGTLNINGSLTMNYLGNSNPRLVQSGGSIVIDGNAGGVTTNSVPLGTPIWGIFSGYLNLSGGSITLVDPHAAIGQPYQIATISMNNGSNRSVGPGHTLYFGDGLSTTPGGYVSGFSIYAPNAGIADASFGNIVINGTASVANRALTHVGALSLQGDFTVNPYGSYQGGAALYAGGDIIVRPNGVFQSTTTLYMTSYAAWGVLLRKPQRISGSGTFTTSSGSNFVGLYLDNVSAGGVTLDIGDVRLGGVNFNKGVLHMANNSVLQITSGGNTLNSSQATGWLDGRMQRFNNGSLRASSLLFAVGDSSVYSPLTILSAYTPPAGSVRVGVTPGDHPNLASSTISPSKSVNRYWTIDTLGALWSANDMSVIPGWSPDQVDPGALWPNFSVVRYAGSSWSTLPTTLPAPASIQATGLSSTMLSGIYQVGEYGAAPVITLQPAHDTICGGGTATFSIAANQVTAFQWQLRSGSVWADLSNGGPYGGVNSPVLSIYGAGAALSGNSYRCLAINSFDTTVSNPATLTLNSSILPTVSISSNAGGPVCVGQQVRFTASSTNGGTAPRYEWRVNGTVAGTNSNIFDWNVGAQDSVNCVLTSDLACASPATVAGSGIRVATTQPVAPAVTIGVTSTGPACAGSNIVFSASVVNGGTAPLYEWVVNGTVVGTSSPTYGSTGFATGDVVRCRLTSNASCLTRNRDTSAPATMYVMRVAAQPSVISGNAAICGSSAQSYSVVLDTSATSYTWTLPSGWSGTSTSNSIAATPGSSGGTISVTANNACGSSTSRTLTVNVGTAPATPAAISGSTSVCSAAAVTYSVTADPNIASYTWTLPSGWSGSSTTNSISVTPGTTGGTISVTGTNGCGTSAARTLTVSVTPAAAQPGAISGSTLLCSGSTQTYSVTLDPSLSGYVWTLPSGWSGSSTSNSISLTAGTGSGTISVSGVNACGSSVARTLAVTAATLPAQPGSISGAAAVCSGISQTYSIAAVTGAATYTWTYPTGWTGSSTANSIALTPATGGGTITVTADNICGSSPAVSFAVTLQAIPATPGAISGSASPCAGAVQTYSVAAVTGATSYTWSAPSGWSGTSSSASIGLTPSSGAGNVTVTASNACGNSSAQVLAVSPVSVPAQPGTISGAAAPCAGSQQTYGVAAVTGATGYVWTLPSGWSGSATTASMVATVGPAGGGTVSVAALNSCGTGVAQTLLVNAVAGVTPTVRITNVLPAVVCAGVPMTLTSAAVNGGNAPAYQWYRNGVAISGATGSTLGITPMAAADTFRVSLTSDAACASPAVVGSTDLVVKGQPQVTPAVQLQAVPGLVVPAGSTVQFVATWTGAGVDSVIVWKRGGMIVPGVSGGSYTAVNVQAGDSVSVELTNRDGCATPATVTAGLALTVTPPAGVVVVGGEAISVRVVPNPSDGRFELLMELGASQFGEPLQLRVFNPVGQLVYREDRVVTATSLRVPVRLPETLAAGLYHVVVGTSVGQVTRPVLLQR